MYAALRTGGSRLVRKPTLNRSSSLFQRSYSTGSKKQPNYMMFVTSYPMDLSQGEVGHGSVALYDTANDEMIFAKGGWPTPSAGPKAPLAPLYIADDTDVLQDKDSLQYNGYPISHEQAKKAMLKLAKIEKRTQQEMAELDPSSPEKAQQVLSGPSKEMESVRQLAKSPTTPMPQGTQMYDMYHNNCIDFVHQIVDATQEVDLSSEEHTPIQLPKNWITGINRPNTLIKGLPHSGPIKDPKSVSERLKQEIEQQKKQDRQQRINMDDL